MSGARVRLLVALAVIAAVAGMIGTYGPPPAATAQAGLFTDTTRQPALRAAATSDRTIVRTRNVEVNFGLIDGTPRAPGSRGGAGETITLNLFSNESALFPAVILTAVRDRVDSSSLSSS